MGLAKRLLLALGMLALVLGMVVMCSGREHVVKLLAQSMFSDDICFIHLEAMICAFALSIIMARL